MISAYYWVDKINFIYLVFCYCMLGFYCWRFFSYR